MVQIAEEGLHSPRGQVAGKMSAWFELHCETLEKGIWVIGSAHGRHRAALDLRTGGWLGLADRLQIGGVGNAVVVRACQRY